MSTDFRPLKAILINELFNGRLAPYGISEVSSTNVDKDRVRGLTDGNNYLSINANDDGTVDSMTARGLGNAPSRIAPSRILAAIAEVFETDIYSEHEPQYLGFDTKEELDAFWEKLAEEDSAKFYTEVINYLNGESHDMKPGTIGMTKANIAKSLVADDRQLLDHGNQEKLMEMIDKIYNEEHSVKITLSDEDLALAKLAVTHEGDLPQA